MTEAVVAHSNLRDSAAAGRDLGEQIARQLGGRRPNALIVFASSRYEYPEFLAALDAACRPEVLVGCSSAGEFTSQAQDTGSASAIGVFSTDISFAAGLGKGLGAGAPAPARGTIQAFRGLDEGGHRFRYALVLMDALAGHGDDLIEELTRLTAGTYQFFGGGAGDDGHFQETHVFLGTEACTDAVVVLEMLSDKPLGIGVRHGWRPASAPMRVTESDGTRLVSLNAQLATESFADHARETEQRFDPAEPLPYFLQNVVGIQDERGHKLRVPLGTNADGSVRCAAEVPQGSTACFMAATTESAAQAAADATRDAVDQLGGLQPAAALFFDCVATRLRTGQGFGFELESVKEALGPSATYAGCNTYGQVARVEGQFSGFHNCTAVVCVIPE